EWLWGIERDGLIYYVDSLPNKIWLRKDVCSMYFNGEFVLFPTHKPHMDAMAFSKLTGCFDHDEDDDSPRRPLKALGQSFRYVFVPLKDAARDLIPASIMQVQTEEDRNGGISPISGRPMPSYVKEYPVIEVYCNPVSVCIYTQKVLHEHLYVKRVNLGIDFRPWTDCLFGFTMRWGCQWHSYARAPQWFVETDERNDIYDEDLTASEASGYCPYPRTNNISNGQSPGSATSSNTANSPNRNRVLE
ncbi:hypothetical protein GGG16DRAFT_47816, partial [Schizophyllum commune]